MGHWDLCVRAWRPVLMEGRRMTCTKSPAENPLQKTIEIQSNGRGKSDQELRSLGENQLSVTLGASNSSTSVCTASNQLN